MKLLGYFIFVVFGFLFRLLPLSIARLLGRGIAVLACLLLSHPRKTAYRNLKASLPYLNDTEIKNTIQKVYLQLGNNLAEFFHLKKNRKTLYEKVIWKNQETVDRLVQQKKGVIALVCHFGNWELHGALWAMRGYPLKVVAFPQSNRLVDAWIKKNRETSGMKVIYTGHRGTHEILQQLKDGGVVGILADQNAGKDGLRLPFLGRDCSVAKAPAVLARKTGAALVPSFLVRNADNSFENITCPPIPVEKTDNVESDIEITTRRWLKVQEEFILKYPDHYFWLHGRWKHYYP